VATYRAGTKPRILCVEDEPGMCDLIRLILEAAGYAFLSAEDGAEGLEAMREEHPDLVLLDLMLPKMDGAEVLLWKGKDPAIQDIPVIAVTALASPFDQIMWKQQTEIKDYVTKPFARKQLLDTIRRVLAGRADELEVASPAGT
jgi:CheY-like chemotaxis protein